MRLVMGTKRSQSPWAACVATAAIVLSLGIPPPVAAYSPSSAASYADTWATNANYCSSHKCFTDNDCASFVSYSLRDGGGYAQAGVGGSTTDDHNWYLRYLVNGGWQYTHSWSVANDLYWFQIYHYPGGGLYGVVDGSTSAWHDGLSVGDLVFYDWDSNGVMNHVSIQVAYGTDPNGGWTGDLVDAHSSNRRHAYWALRPYNSQWATTRIYLVDIFSGN